VDAETCAASPCRRKTAESLRDYPLICRSLRIRAVIHIPVLQQERQRDHGGG
jgi:hypothetical protein